MPETLAAEADALTATGSKAGADRLGCELLLLAGRLDPEVTALTGSGPLGWNHAGHPGTFIQPFLLADAIRGLTVDAERRDLWLTTAAAVVDARINAIVSGGHRGAYARAAGLAHAHAETLAGSGRVAAASTYLATIRARFPRDVASRGEVDAAADTSTLRIRRPDPTGP